MVCIAGASVTVKDGKFPKREAKLTEDTRAVATDADAARHGVRVAQPDERQPGLLHAALALRGRGELDGRLDPRRRIGSVTRWGDLLVGVGRDVDPSGLEQRPDRVMTSTDGVTWTDLPGFDSGSTLVSGIRVVGDELIVDGQITNIGMYPFATAWRSTDGTDWQPISLGLPTGGTGSFITGVIQTSGGLVFLGTAQIGETESVPVMWSEP